VRGVDTLSVGLVDMVAGGMAERTTGVGVRNVVCRTGSRLSEQGERRSGSWVGEET
jgi:hypothetical protein